MVYPKTEAKADFVKIEHQILEFLRDQKIFEKSLDNTKSGKPFSFYDGPPFANGLPHWGHIGVSAIKDMVCRYQTMNGKFVERELGWDCHGLPAENSVEKKEDKLAKDIVAERGMDVFCDLCRADVQTYTKEWLVFIERIGRWVKGGDDFGYRTMDLSYMDSVIGTLKALYEKDLFYKDYRVNPFDWKLGTVLSNSEASQEYQDIEDVAVSVWFGLSDGRRLIAWTTTPWTLPGNQALAVNKNIDYVEIKASDNHIYVLAKNRIESYSKQFGEHSIIREFKGSELVGMKYEPLFGYYNNSEFQNSEFMYSVIAADYVSSDNGTGIVHIAPAFGEEDFWAVKNLDQNFPIIVNVDNYGNFTDEVLDFAGQNIFDMQPKIIEKLKTAGFLVKKEQYKHSYPMSYRSKEKLIYRATDSWYINVPKIKDKLIQNNNKVNWTSAGGRFSDWIANARPWSVSRNRFWGTPLPIWENEKGEMKFFGSIKEIENFFGVEIKDLHRPTLDNLTVAKDGSIWNRIPDVLDCWVESGSMPWAAVGFNPYTDKGLPKNFPADYIIEGQDQTRGWFYSLMVLSTALFDMPAFKTVSANGMIVDENKKKFSKSLKNFVNPDTQIEQFGADAVRLFILGSNFMKAEPLPVDKEGKVFNEPLKNILTPLWNAYHFFTLYANAANIKVESKGQKSEGILDKYILSELDELIVIVKLALDEYKPDVAISGFIKFLDILNNWYIRRSRERFWNEDISAFETLNYVLITVCKLLAPFAPFISDFIFKNLSNLTSVHLESFPEVVKSKDFESIFSMRMIQNIVSTGKQLRENYKLRNRLPVQKISIFGRTFDKHYAEILRDELNAKDIVFNKDNAIVADSFVYPITPRIAERLGGAALKEILPAIKNKNYEEKDNKLNVSGFELNSNEYEIRLTVKDGITGAALPDNTAVVVIDTNITDELTSEGLANDALRFIQDTRKTADLNVSDHIKLYMSGDSEIITAMKKFESRVKTETLSDVVEYSECGDFTIEIEGRVFNISLEKIL